MSVISERIKQRMEEVAKASADLEYRQMVLKEEQISIKMEEAEKSMQLIKKTKAGELLDTINNELLSGNGTLKTDQGVIEHDHSSVDVEGRSWSSNATHGVAYVELRWSDNVSQNESEVEARKYIKISSGDNLLFIMAGLMTNDRMFDEHSFPEACVYRTQYHCSFIGNPGKLVNVDNLEPILANIFVALVNAKTSSYNFASGLE